MRLQKCTYIKIPLILICCMTIFASCGKIKKDPKFTTAIVNGKAITRATFDKEMERVKKKFQGKTSGNFSEADGIQGEILEILIGGELLYQASLEKGISVSKKEIAADLKKVTTNLQADSPDAPLFDKEDIKRKIAIEKFITQEFSDPTIISDSESKKYYNDNLDDFTKPEQVMVSHIILTVTPKAKPAALQAARDQLTEIKEKINNGADFAEMAKDFSQGSTAKNGGALGYIMRGQMTKPFEKAAFSMEKGAVSDLVQTKYGLHLIKVLDKKPMVVISYEEIEKKLKAYLKQQKVQKKIDSFLKEQRAAAKIEIFLPKTS